MVESDWILKDVLDISPEIPEDKVVRCPLCMFEYVHIEAVKVNAGGEITEITHSGVCHQKGEPSGRGARIEITFWCENGHRWVRSMQFHKGITYVEDSVLERAKEFWIDWHDLWRD